MVEATSIFLILYLLESHFPTSTTSSSIPVVEAHRSFFNASFWYKSYPISGLHISCKLMFFYKPPKYNNPIKAFNSSKSKYLLYVSCYTNTQSFLSISWLVIITRLSCIVSVNNKDHASGGICIFLALSLADGKSTNSECCP